MRAFIGYSGFVGSNILNHTKFDDFYDINNIEEIKGKSYDFILSAGTPAVKWLANKEPEKDMQAINKLLDCLKEVKAKKFVLISTIDVYPNQTDVNESSEIDTALQQPYGKHRYMMENFIRQRFDTTVIRLPNLFGEGLKKNIIFDFLNNHEVEKIDSEGVFQYYNLDNLWKDISIALDNELKTLNIATEPISVKDIAKYAFEIDFENKIANKPIFCDFHTENSKIFGKKGNYLYTKKEILDDLKKFVFDYKNYKLKLAISNIAWVTEEDQTIANFLLKHNIKGLEIGPDRLFDSNFAFDKIKIKKYKEWCEKQNLKLVSMQGILFTKNNLKLFESEENRKETQQYLKKVIDVCSDLGIKIVMFGSPKNRIKGHLSKQEAEVIAVPFFREIARHAYQQDVIFCIEHNPKEYGGDYILTASEALELSRKISHPAFGINIDAGALIMSGDNYETIINCGNYIKHFHISQPNLSSIINMNQSEEKLHKSFGDALKKIKYNGWISIEMKKSSQDAGQDNADVLIKSIEKVKDVYRV